MKKYYGISGNFNGKWCNTDTANAVVVLGCGNPHRKERTLYKKRNGEYFLLTLDPDNKTDFEITPMTESEARTWRDENLI